jgi:hypothetical protein
MKKRTSDAGMNGIGVRFRFFGELRSDGFQNDRCSKHHEHETEHDGETDRRIHEIVAGFFIHVLAGITSVFHGKPPGQTSLLLVYPTSLFVVKV